MRSISVLFSVLACVVALASPALASDGVVEINQTCAVQTGCIDNSEDIGDIPGFPVNIEYPGSYVLTSNLVVSDANRSAIFIGTAGVTIDLNGYEIRGPVICSGSGSFLTCGPGSGRGIFAQGRPRITVLNGSVSQFGSDGILVGSNSHIERVVAERNGGNGIDVFRDSIVIDSRAARNGGDGIEADLSSVIRNSTSASNRVAGISVGDDSIVAGSTARDNGTSGISVGRGATVESCTAADNENLGITTSTGSTVASNAVRQNGANGIAAGGGSTVLGNTAYENGAAGIRAGSGSTVSGNSAYDNGEEGILAIGTCMVKGNTIHSNTGAGLRFGINLGLSGYRENVISGNSGGDVSGTGVDMGANVIDGSVTSTP